MGVDACIYFKTRAVPSGYQVVPVEVVKFAAKVFTEHRDSLCDIDGGWLQDTLQECGLLKQVTVTSPCGESCRCAESGDFPTECMFNTDAADAMLAAAKVSDT